MINLTMKTICLIFITVYVPPEDNTLVVALAVTFSLLGVAIIIIIILVLYFKVCPIFLYKYY